MKKALISAVAFSFVVLSCTPKTITASQTVQQEYTAKGKTVFENSCAKCHDLPDPKKYDDQKWIGIMNSMAPKAKLSNEQSTMVYDYVISIN